MQNEILASGAEIIRETNKFAHVKRADGMNVFLDKFDPSDEFAEALAKLNHVRLHGSREEVVMMLVLLRGVQVGKNYCRREALEMPILDRVLKSLPNITALVNGPQASVKTTHSVNGMAKEEV